MLPGFVVPGQIVVSATNNDFKKYTAGTGVEVSPRGINATLLGRLTAEKVGSKWTLNVCNEVRNPYAEIPTELTGNSKRTTSNVPQVGDTVYGRVVRLAQKQAVCDIIAVENQGILTPDSSAGVFASSLGSVHPSVGINDRTNELGHGYGGVIRIQDIRATERDKVVITDMFCPGDLVRAVVLALGDGNKYYLSTVRNDCGVVFARDPKTGTQLVPLDWSVMADPDSGNTYKRKCANPFV